MSLLPATTPLAGLAQQVDQLCAQPSDVAPPPAASVPTGAVQHTIRYHLFSLLDANRPVNEAHVQKLAQQIQHNNLLHIRPIDVTPDLAVIDGQHRLAAAKELGVPVYYRVTEQLTEADIAALNTASRNWTGTDYLHYWTEKQVPAYVALTAFRQQYPRISFSNAKLMVSGTADPGADAFRSGTWQAGDVSKGEETARLVERISTETSFSQAASTRFVAALYHCVVHVPGFQPAQLMHKVLQQPRLLVPCATHKQYLELLSEIYNYKTAQENRVRFA